MEKTRLMQVLFSAVEKGDEKLTNMVGEDIRTAVENGTVEDKMNGLSYEHKGDGVVAITDKETGEVTMAERDPEGAEDEFNLWTPDEQIEGFVHPEGDGVTPGEQEGAPDEHAEDHVEGGSIANQPEEPTVEEKAEGEQHEEGCECPECKEEEKEFSENSAFQKVFSRQALVEALYSEVIESEQTSNVGDLKFEKVPGEDAVVVTDTKTGHQVKVEIDDENIHVAELESKAFGEDGEGQEPEPEPEPEAQAQDSVGYFVVGLDVDNHQLVESQEAAQEAAEVAAHRFVENGFVGVQILDNLEDASAYARDLLSHLNADEEQEAEVEVKEFSDGSVYFTRTFSSNHNDLMYRLFSESVACDGDCPSEDKIKDALEGGEEVEVEDDVIIPLREDLGLVHDTENDEYTKVEMDEDGELSYEDIDEEEAQDLIKEFSTYCNEAETRFFSGHEVFTEYMTRLFSEEADEEDIVEAIKEGNQIEKDKEIITPVDDITAIIEDKENGEFTKAVLQGEEEEEINVTPITEEEASELTEGLEVEKTYSYCNEAGTRFFSENEVFTEYMTRLFSEEADEEELVEVIENGDVVEKEKEIITPVDDTTAVIEDKENGEFTKATLEGEDQIDVVAITEDEAKELLDKTEEGKEEEKEKEFSTLDKFFSAIAPVEGATKQEVTLLPGQSVVIVDEEGNPVEQPSEEEKPTSVEEIEDKALAAVQSIQEAAAAAEQAIQEAKAAPAENTEAPLQEAQFSQKTYSENPTDTLLTWLNGNKIG